VKSRADKFSAVVAALEVLHFAGRSGGDPLIEAGALLAGCGRVERRHGGDSGEGEARLLCEFVHEG